MTKFKLPYLVLFNLSVIVFNLSLLPGSVAVMDFERDLVFGRHFIIGTAEIPPFIIIKRDHNGTMLRVDGFVHQILPTLKYIVQAKSQKWTLIGLNTSSPLMAPLVHVKTTPATAWSACLFEEIDFIATGLAMTLPRSHAIDFTFPFRSEPVNLLIPYPRKNSALDSIFDPFDTEVWILIALSMVVYSFLMSWVGYMRTRWFNLSYGGTTGNFESNSEIARKPGKFGDNFMFLLSVLVNPGYRVYSEFGEAFRVLVAVWCLIAVVVSNSYNTSVKSFLMLSRYKPVIRSLDDLTENSEYTFVAKKYSSVWSNMMEAETGPFAKIGDILRKHPENSLETLDNSNDFVINGKKILAQFKASNLFMIQEDMKSSGKCRLYTAVEPFDEQRISFGLPKKSHILNHFLSHELMWLKQSGLLECWRKSYWPRTNRCSAPISTEPASKTEKLTLDYLSGAFLLFGAGLVLSLTSFAAEFIRSYHHRRIKVSLIDN